MSCDRVGCSLYPGDDGAHPGWRASPTGVCRILNGQSLHPATTSHCARLRVTRHQQEFKQLGDGDCCALVGDCAAEVQRLRHPVFPSPVTPRSNGSALGFPPSFERRRPRAGRRTSGRGQATEHGPEQRSSVRRTSNLVFTRIVRPRVAPSHRFISSIFAGEPRLPRFAAKPGRRKLTLASSGGPLRRQTSARRGSRAFPASPVRGLRERWFTPA